MAAPLRYMHYRLVHVLDWQEMASGASLGNFTASVCPYMGKNRQGDTALLKIDGHRKIRDKNRPAENFLQSSCTHKK